MLKVDHKLLVTHLPNLATTLQNPVLFLIRVVVAWAFLRAAILLIGNWDQTLASFESYGWVLIHHTITAYICIGIMFVFPTFLILGFFSRSSALIVGIINLVMWLGTPDITMAESIFRFHWNLILLVLCTIGAGTWSYDHYLSKKLK